MRVSLRVYAAVSKSLQLFPSHERSNYCGAFDHIPQGKQSDMMGENGQTFLLKRHPRHDPCKNHWRCGENMNTKASMNQYQESMQMVRDDD
jgi:hypothetical protein